MEIVIPFEIFRLQILRDKFESGSQIHGKSPFGIGCGDEYHRPSRGLGAFEQSGFDAILSLVAFEEVPQVVVADFADETGVHAEYGRSGDGVGG